MRVCVFDVRMPVIYQYELHFVYIQLNNANFIKKTKYIFISILLNDIGSFCFISLIFCQQLHLYVILVHDWCFFSCKIKIQISFSFNMDSNEKNVLFIQIRMNHTSICRNLPHYTSFIDSSILVNCNHS